MSQLSQCDVCSSFCSYCKTINLCVPYTLQFGYPSSSKMPHLSLNLQSVSALPVPVQLFSDWWLRRFIIFLPSAVFWWSSGNCDCVMIVVATWHIMLDAASNNRAFKMVVNFPNKDNKFLWHNTPISKVLNKSKAAYNYQWLDCAREKKIMVEKLSAWMLKKSMHLVN